MQRWGAEIGARVRHLKFHDVATSCSASTAACAAAASKHIESLPHATQGPVLEYDIIGHPQSDFHFAVSFPFHSADGGSVTLIREYAQAGGASRSKFCTSMVAATRRRQPVNLILPRVCSTPMTTRRA